MSVVDRMAVVTALKIDVPRERPRVFDSVRLAGLGPVDVQENQSGRRGEAERDATHDEHARRDQLPELTVERYEKHVPGGEPARAYDHRDLRAEPLRHPRRDARHRQRHQAARGDTETREDEDFPSPNPVWVGELHQLRLREQDHVHTDSDRDRGQVREQDRAGRGRTQVEQRRTDPQLVPPPQREHDHGTGECADRRRGTPSPQVSVAEGDQEADHADTQPHCAHDIDSRARPPGRFRHDGDDAGQSDEAENHTRTEQPAQPDELGGHGAHREAESTAHTHHRADQADRLEHAVAVHDERNALMPRGIIAIVTPWRTRATIIGPTVVADAPIADPATMQAMAMTIIRR